MPSARLGDDGSLGDPSIEAGKSPRPGPSIHRLEPGLVTVLPPPVSSRLAMIDTKLSAGIC